MQRKKKCLIFMLATLFQVCPMIRAKAGEFQCRQGMTKCRVKEVVQSPYREYSENGLSPVYWRAKAEFIVTFREKRAVVHYERSNNSSYNRNHSERSYYARDWGYYRSENTSSTSSSGQESSHEKPTVVTEEIVTTRQAYDVFNEQRKVEDARRFAIEQCQEEREEIKDLYPVCNN